MSDKPSADVPATAPGVALPPASLPSPDTALPPPSATAPGVALPPPSMASSLESKAKVIPISVVAQEPKSVEAEIHGCAELEPYALRVLGDSMAPEFLEGHVVIVDPGMHLSHGAYVVIDY